jgi:hypothetical protein
MTPEHKLPTDEKVSPEQRRSNARLGLFLGAIAVAIFVGFIAKSVVFGM